MVPLENAYNWSRSQTSLAFTLNIIFFSVGCIVVGLLCKKYSFSTLLKLAALIIGIGFLLSSFVNKITYIYFTYSFLCGSGTGIGYICVISSIPLWFLDKQGIITGILLMGHALSTAILGPLVNQLIELTNISITFQVLTLVCFIGLILGSLFLKHHR